MGQDPVARLPRFINEALENEIQKLAANDKPKEGSDLNSSDEAASRPEPVPDDQVLAETKASLTLNPVLLNIQKAAREAEKRSWEGTDKSKE